MSRTNLVRKFRKEDKEAMISMFEEVWTKELADNLRRTWEWKFENNPHDPPEGNKTLVLEQNGRIIGMYGFLSGSIKIKGKIYPVIMAIDFAVHPENRGGGVRLMNYVKKNYDAIKFGVVTVGRPYEFYVKMGFPDFFQVSLFKKILNPKSFFQKKLKNKAVVLLIAFFFRSVTLFLSLFRTRPTDKDISTSEISSFDDRFDEFWNEASETHDISMVRDKNFLNWRFIDCPTREYTMFAAEKKEKILGYIVLRHKTEDKKIYGTVVDIFTKKNDKKVQQILISQAIAHFKTKHVDIITCPLSPKCGSLRNTLIKNGFFIKAPGAKVVGGPGGYPELETDLRKPKNWLLTLMTSDMEL